MMEFYHKYDEETEIYICHCDAPMVLRTNKRTGQKFFGCSRFPDCDVTYNATAGRFGKLQDGHMAVYYISDNHGNNTNINEDTMWDNPYPEYN